MAPTSGRMHPVASFIVYGAGVGLVLALLVLTTYANISVWFGSATGHDRYVFGVSGLVFEIWGAIGLIIALHQMAIPGATHKARGMAALALWFPAVLFNAYTTQRYFAIENSEKAGVVVTDQTLATQSRSKITELEAELASIGLVRTPQEVIAERDVLPNNYRTRRRELTAELGRAERRAEVMADLETARENQLASVGSSVASAHVTVDAGKILTGLGIWIEAFKALGLWILLGSRAANASARDAERVPQTGQGGRRPTTKAKRVPEPLAPAQGPEKAALPTPIEVTSDKVVEIRPKTEPMDHGTSVEKKTRYL